MDLLPKTESQIFEELEALSINEFRYKITNLRISIKIYKKAYEILQTTDEFPYLVLTRVKINNRKDADQFAITVKKWLEEKENKLAYIHKMFKDCEFF